MIDLSINKEGLAHNIQKAKENNIIIPTIAQMQNPDLVPDKIKEKLAGWHHAVRQARLSDEAE